MRVKIEVEFDVHSDEDGLTEKYAQEAAEMAVYHHLAFTKHGDYANEEIEQHVDGFGKCTISIPTDRPKGE